MTFKRLLIFLLLQWLLALAVKYIFFDILQFLYPATEALLFVVVLAVIASALVRRLGVLNYLEAIYAAILVLVIDFFADAVITNHVLGQNTFLSWYTWIGYLTLMLSIFLSHKKRHVHIREEMHKHHHDHH